MSVFCKRFIKLQIMFLIYTFWLRNTQRTELRQRTGLQGSFLSSNCKKYWILERASSFWLHLFQKGFIWSSNVNLLWKLITRGFSDLLLEIAVPPKLIWISSYVFVRRWDLSGFAFRRSSVNHLIKDLTLFPYHVRSGSKFC